MNSRAHLRRLLPFLVLVGTNLSAWKSWAAPVAPVTAEDRAAAFPELHHDMHHAGGVQQLVMFDQIEYRHEALHPSGVVDAHGWIGTDTRRLWLSLDVHDNDHEDLTGRFEAHYGRSVSAWWELLAGVRQDTAEGDDRSAVSIGFRGVTPWFVETLALADIDRQGKSRLRVEFTHNLLLTNRLILQSGVEVQVLGRNDTEQDLAAGFATLEAGLRLRYEFTRQFAPYIGVLREQSLGDTRDLRRETGESVSSTQLVAGFRLWF